MKTQNNHFIFYGLLITILSSSCGEEKSLKDGDTIFFPDTTAFIRNWSMNEKQMRADIFAADSMYNQLPLDTFQLTYSMCDCPDWIDRTKGDINCIECTDFYIEPADSSLELPWEFGVSGNTVQFYGVLIPGYNLPHGREFTVPDPPEWSVIRYYGFEVVRPYVLWGPQMKEFQEPGDTLSHSVQVTICR